MAKRICPFCKEKVKENATICKYCKSGLPALPPKKWYQTWKGFFLTIFILGIFAQAFKEEPTSTSSQKSTAQSSSATTEKMTKSENTTSIDEKTALKDSYFGNFKKAKIQKKSGTVKLEAWQPWIQHLKQNLSQQAESAILDGQQELTVSFDEVWVSEYDEYLKESDKKKYKGRLDISKLYWQKGKVQAYTIENYHVKDPVTGTNLSNPGHKISDIYDRIYILNKLNKK